MKKAFLLLLACALLPAAPCRAQGLMHGNGAPTSATNCAGSRFYVDDSTAILYIAASGSPCIWGLAGAAPTQGLSNVTNDVQTKAAIVPNTIPTAAQLLLGNGSGAYAAQSATGDVNFSSSAVATVIGVNGAAVPVSAAIAGTDPSGRIVAAATSSSTLPATCTKGDFWSGDPSGATNAIAYGCVATNTWLPYAMTRQISGYCNGVATSNSTLTLPNLGASSATGTCTGGATAGLGTRMASAGKLLSLSVSCGTTGVDSTSGAFTVWIQPVGSATPAATTMTITYGKSTDHANWAFVTDAAHPTAISAGDIVSVRFTTFSSGELLGTCGAVISYV